MAGRPKDPNSRTEFVGVRFSKAERKEIEDAFGENFSVSIRQAALARARGGQLKRNGRSQTDPDDLWEWLGGERKAP